MKQKIEMRVSMHCEKCRKKAKKIAAATHGVDYLSLEGDEKDKLVVTGDGIDSYKLIKKLRKKVAFTEVLKLEEVKKEEKKEVKKDPEPPKYYYWTNPNQVCTCQVYYDPNPSWNCSIM